MIPSSLIHPDLLGAWQTQADGTEQWTYHDPAYAQYVGDRGNNRQGETRALHLPGLPAAGGHTQHHQGSGGLQVPQGQSGPIITQVWPAAALAGQGLLAAPPAALPQSQHRVPPALDPQALAAAGVYLQSEAQAQQQPPHLPCAPSVLPSASSAVHSQSPAAPQGAQPYTTFLPRISPLATFEGQLRPVGTPAPEAAAQYSASPEEQSRDAERNAQLRSLASRARGDSVYQTPEAKRDASRRALLARARLATQASVAPATGDEACAPWLMHAGPMRQELQSLDLFHRETVADVASLMSHRPAREQRLALSNLFLYSAAIADGHGDTGLADRLADGAVVLLHDAAHFTETAVTGGTDIVLGVLKGLLNAPTHPVVHGKSSLFALGEMVGSATGLFGDAAAVAAAATFGGSSVVVAAGSAGVLAAPATAVTAAAATVVVAGAAAATGHWERLQAAQNTLMKSEGPREGVRPPEGSGSTAPPANRAVHERYVSDLRATMERPEVTCSELKQFLKEFWRPTSKIGNGSTAAAVRHELTTGERVGNATHSIKARNGVRALMRWASRHPEATAHDKLVAKQITQATLESLKQ